MFKCNIVTIGQIDLLNVSVKFFAKKLDKGVLYCWLKQVDTCVKIKVCKYLVNAFIAPSGFDRIFRALLKKGSEHYLPMLSQPKSFRRMNLT